MNLDLPPDVMTQLTSMQESIQSLHAEIRLVRAELKSRPVEPLPPQKWYSTAEVASMFQKSEYTVRQWCNEGRINAEKREERRGNSELWKISDEVVARYRSEGLLGPDPSRNRDW